mgnify:CR=1 FL=1
MESNYLNLVQRKTLSAVFVTIKIHLNLYFLKLKNIVVRIIITIAINKTPDTGRFTKSYMVFIWLAPAVSLSIIIEPKTIPRTIGTKGQSNRRKINPR